MKKVVTIGGGTGHYTLLRGLKNYDVDLTAIVSMVDDGGKSTKRLRTEFGILPPGDLRNCLLALANESQLKDLMDLFEHRFPKTENESSLAGHSLGNLILTALTQQHGDIGKAVKVASGILGLSGKVLPVSLDKSDLYAETESGKVLNGQTQVSYPEKEAKIKKIWLEPKASIYKETAESIRKADLIVISPGDFYGSIISNFLVSGIKEALQESKAKIVYVCNLVTKQGTYGFKAKDFVEEIEKYSGRRIDYVILNTKKPTQLVVDKYKGEDSYFVEPEMGNLEREVKKEELLIEHKSNEKIIARHDQEKTARLIMSLL